MRSTNRPRSLIRRADAGLRSPVLESLESRTLMTTVFGPNPVVSTGPQIHGQIVADFDGDGINDVAGLEVGADKSILFFKGRGDGSFDAALRTTLKVRVSAIAAGQWISGGGMELVAIGGAGEPITVDASGGGNAYRATFVRVLRFDSASGKLKVMSSGVVAAPAAGDSGASTPIIGDFTGDGLADIAFAPSAAKGRLVVMERSENGLRVASTFTLPALTGDAANQASGPIGVDLDGDGRLDIVSRGDTGYVALLNSSEGLGAATISLGLSTAIDWKFADVDGDGKADAVGLWLSPDQQKSTAADRYGEVQIAKGLGGGAFAPLQTIGRVMTGAGGSGTDHEWLLVGQDIDHDGLGDIVYVHDFDAADASSHTVRERVVAITHGIDGAWSIPNFALGPNERIGVAGDNSIEVLGGKNEIVVDLNGDGRADLLDFGAGPIQAYLSSEFVSLASAAPAKSQLSAASAPEAAALRTDWVVAESRRVAIDAGTLVADAASDASQNGIVAANLGPTVLNSAAGAIRNGEVVAEAAAITRVIVRDASRDHGRGENLATQQSLVIASSNQQATAAVTLDDQAGHERTRGTVAAPTETDPAPQQQAQSAAQTAATSSAAESGSIDLNAASFTANQPLLASTVANRDSENLRPDRSQNDVRSRTRLPVRRPLGYKQDPLYPRPALRRSLTRAQTRTQQVRRPLAKDWRKSPALVGSNRRP